MVSRAFGVTAMFAMAVAFGCQRAQQETAQQETARQQEKPAEVQQPSAGKVDVGQLIEQLQSDDDDVQSAAAAALAELGDGAAPAVETLIAQLKDNDPEVRAHSARALGMIGNPAVVAAEPLAELVADEDATVRRMAVGALANIKPGADQVVPLMIKMLSDADPQVLALATHSLAEAGPSVVPAMIKAMEDEQTVYFAILVLAELGPDAKEAVPALAQALSHEDAEVRHEAAQALRAIGPGASAAVPDLVKSLDDKQIAVLLPSVLALGSIGPGAIDAADKLRSFSQGDDDLLKVCALWAIEKIEPDDQRLKTETVPALVNLLLNEDPNVRNAAAFAVLQLEPGSEVVAPLFAEAFGKASEEARVDMISAIASLGGQAVPRLVVGLEYPNVRRQIIEVLGEMGPEAAEAVPALLKHVDDEDPATRADIFVTLGHIGPAAKAATEAATKALQDSEQEVQSSAVYALGSIGPDAAVCADQIIKLMDSGNPRLTTVCAWALVHIDPSNQEYYHQAIPLLMEAINSERVVVRVEAISTLGMIGPAAREALESLAKLADDPDPAVREAAAEAIKMIDK